MSDLTPARPRRARFANTLFARSIFGAALVSCLALTSACPSSNNNGAAEVAIEVGGAEPQDTPVPTADANSAEAPQITGLIAPDIVRPGQIVALRLTTDFSPPEELSGVAITIEGVNGWFRAEAVAEPAAASDSSKWVITLPVTVAESADANDLAAMQVALLGVNDKAGTFREWRPSIDAKSPALMCPIDGDCTALSCGPDPLCGVSCGSCDASEACNAVGACEELGAACPDAASCGARECGPDPVCGSDCGDCGPGTACTFGGSCEPDPNAPGVVATQLVAGASHVCALHVTGQVKCWGDHAFGQLGLGDVDRHGDQANEMGFNLPVVDLGADALAIQIASGQDHSCALLEDGTVKCWGLNDQGQLGLGDTKNRGDDLDEMGDALAAVSLGFTQVDEVCAGAGISCARSGGSVKCWGLNDHGQLGQGDVESRGDQVGELGNSLAAIDLGSGAQATQLSCGSRHVCARLNDESVKCWGYNQGGQLGLEDTNARGDEAGEMGDALAAVNLGAAVQEVRARWSHSCALTSEGLKCWGDNDNGGLGLGDRAPRGASVGDMGASLPLVNLAAGGTLLQLAVGFGHSCAVLPDSSLRCWGFNGGGALGYGDTSARGDDSGEMGANLAPVNLGSGLEVLDVAGGNSFSCALLRGTDIDGEVKCWGSNARGQLGLGDTRTRGDGPDEMGDALGFVDLW